MPHPGKRWWHTILNTHSSWLPGDPRGFRSHHHRLHSTGDYHHPPPPQEHHPLHQYHRQRHPKPVTIPLSLRLQVALTLVQTLITQGHRVLVVSVAGQHAHLVAELPINIRCYNQAIGQAKLTTSRSVTNALPGRIWARHDKHLMKRTPSELRNAYNYVRNLQGSAAAVWTFKGYQYDPAAPRRRSAQ